MDGKIMGLILKGIEKFLSRIVIVRRGYGENILRKGFNQASFQCTLESFVILGDNKSANKKKVEDTAKKLVKECERLVRNDIDKDPDKMIIEEDTEQENNEDKS